LEFIRGNRPSLPIAPIINNFNQNTQDWDASELSNMLSNPESRAALIRKLEEEVQKNNFSGISIDFCVIMITAFLWRCGLDY